MLSSDDPFEGISNLEGASYNAGYEEGVLSGKRAAFVQGFRLGQTTSRNVTSELAEYDIICRLYVANKLKEQTIEAKGIKAAQTIIDIIASFDFVDCHSDTFSVILSRVRDKFKAFCSLVHISAKQVAYSDQQQTKMRLNF